MRILFTIVLLAAHPLHADGLADVRVSLAKLAGRDPIRATYEVQRVVKNEGRFDNKEFSGKAAVELEGDANGVRVQYARPLLEQIEREQQVSAVDPKQPAPTVSAINAIGATELADAIDYAPSLLHLLDGAKVVEDRAGTWGGKPSRIVIVRLADKMDIEVGKVTVSVNKLTLWLGEDAVPLAAEHVLNLKYSFLILKGESKTKQSWHFARIGDRLVRTRHESHEMGSGFGQKGIDTMIATLRVH